MLGSYRMGGSRSSRIFPALASSHLFCNRCAPAPFSAAFDASCRDETRIWRGAEAVEALKRDPMLICVRDTAGLTVRRQPQRVLQLRGRRQKGSAGSDELFEKVGRVGFRLLDECARARFCNAATGLSNAGSQGSLVNSLRGVRHAECGRDRGRAGVQGEPRGYPFKKRVGT